MNPFTKLYDDYLQKIAVTPYSERPTNPGYSDMVAHLPVLQWYASQCWHVTEFGTREGHSTLALISGARGIVHSYDIDKPPSVMLLRRFHEHGHFPIPWVFHHADTGDPNVRIEDTDFILFDTEHTYTHLKKELFLHARRSRRYLAFHDTQTCGYRDASGNDPNAKGIIPAMEEFFANFPGEYTLVYSTSHCNGLMIYEWTGRDRMRESPIYKIPAIYR